MLSFTNSSSEKQAAGGIGSIGGRKRIATSETCRGKRASSWLFYRECMLVYPLGAALAF
jgi:hypothetical protein